GLLAYLDFRAGPHPGDRAPDVVLGTSPPRRLFDILSATRHTLLALLGAARSAEGDRAIEAVGELVRERFRDRIDAHLVLHPDAPADGLRWGGDRLADPAGHLHHRYGAEAPTLYLIRPDGYVGYRSLPPDAGKLTAYLGRVFR